MIARVGFVIFLLSLTSLAQQTCPSAPALQPIPPSENIFSDAQEVDLGDAMAESLALHVNIIRDDELTAHLRVIANQLVQQLPPTHMNFRFYLVDLPEVNAFSIAGGRVYVSRKLIAFARNDDELAGVIGHELGHIVTHQMAIDMTRGFREALGVNEVGDRNDIFKKFHQYVENAARHPKPKYGQEEKHQLVADQVSIFTIARAGFPPEAMVDFWDRLGELHGKRGNWFTDIFGSTTPEQHRLREMIKNTAALPPGCATQKSVADEASFKVWQEAVVDYDSPQPESLPGLISKHRIKDRLRPDIRNLRFSPDGNYILAQDDAGISLATRSPFAFLFYIPAPDARDAQFSPNSASVVFLTSGLRVEVWNIAERKRTSVHEITFREFCLQTELSPDGNTLACLNSHFALLLFDVGTAAVLQEKKDFFIPSWLEFIQLFLKIGADEERDAGSSSGSSQLVSLKFSPDGRFFLARSHLNNLLYDIAGRRAMSEPGSIKDLSRITFMSDNRIAGINSNAPKKSRILRFPSGEVVEDKVPLAPGIRLRAATHGDYLLVGPLEHDPMGVMDLKTKEISISVKRDTIDVFDDFLLTERIGGQIVLHSMKTRDTLATLTLPEAGLGRLKAAVVSPDLNYLAVSSQTRGAVWDLASDTRVFHVRGFDGATFDGRVVFADFPKFEESPRAIGELNMDTGAGGVHRQFENEVAREYGGYLVELKAHNKNGFERSNADIQVEDVKTGQMLWSRYFPGVVPSIHFDSMQGTVLMYWRLSDPGARDELQRFSELKQKADKNDYLCEVADANLGGLISTFIVKSNNGSLRYLQGMANHSWAVLQAPGDQILSFALPSGEGNGHFFGTHPVLSASGLLVADSGKSEITLYDLATAQETRQYMFAEPVAWKVFSADGKRLLVLTTDQTVYLLDMATSSPDPALASNP